MKRTPLFSAHKRAGAKLIEFGGWEMPVFYTSIADEHRTVRSAVGMFDIAHMGEVSVSGPGAPGFLNYVLTNDASRLRAGQGQYTLMCNAAGGVIDDLYLYRLAEERFLLIINASRIDADLGWLQQQLAQWEASGMTLENISDELGAIAVQGPRAAAVLDALYPAALPGKLKKNELVSMHAGGGEVHVARTGYTGEDGFEIVAPAGELEPLWDRLLELGASHGLKPAGLGARDTLRTEACYPLYGHELNESTTPIEAGLGFFVALDKPKFIGRDTLARQKAEGPAKRLVAFKMADRSAPPRPGYPIWSTGSDARQIGEVASGTQSPSLNVGVGLGYVPPAFSKAQTPLEIEIRGRKALALVVTKPIYRRPDQQ